MLDIDFAEIKVAGSMIQMISSPLSFLSFLSVLVLPYNCMMSIYGLEHILNFVHDV